MLRAQVGSGMHGTSITGQDDRDEMGLCLEPAAVRDRSRARARRAVAHGDGRVRAVPPAHGLGPSPVAWRTGPVPGTWTSSSTRPASGHGWRCPGTRRVMLARSSSRDAEVVYRDEVGVELTVNAHRFVSRLAGERFLGYLQAQKAAMTGESGAHTNRPELVAEHGYDTKYAMHALRLGVQGIELLTTGPDQPARPGTAPELPAVRARGEGCRCERSWAPWTDVETATLRSAGQSPRSRPSRTGGGSTTWLHRLVPVVLVRRSIEAAPRQGPRRRRLPSRVGGRAVRRTSVGP